MRSLSNCLIHNKHNVLNPLFKASCERDQAKVFEKIAPVLCEGLVKKLAEPKPVAAVAKAESSSNPKTTDVAQPVFAGIQNTGAVFGPVAATPAAAVPAAASSAGSSLSSSGKAVFGPCSSTEVCDGSVPKYSWGIPSMVMGIPIDMYHYAGDDKRGYYEQPTATCGPENQGELMAVDFGNETRAVVCMGDPNQKIEELLKKVKAADVDKLPTEIAGNKAIYNWEVLVKEKPLDENEGGRFCTSVGKSCDVSMLGEVTGSSPCDIYKCVLVAPPVKTTKKEKPEDKKDVKTEDRGVVSSPEAPAPVTAPAPVVESVPSNSGYNPHGPDFMGGENNF